MGWTKDSTYIDYSLEIVSLLMAAPADATTYYIGSLGSTWFSAAGQCKVYIPKAATITKVYLHWLAGTAGTGESISIYVRLNNTTDYLVQAVANTSAIKSFINTGLSIPVVAGDFVEIKIVTPTWATNPANVYIGGSIFAEA